MGRTGNHEALAVALRYVARRPRTESEVRVALVGAGYGPDEIDDVVARLIADRTLDDEGLALHWIVVRSERLGHGPRRLVADLVRRGVPEALAARAWQRAVRDGHVEPDELLARAVDRRLADTAADDDRGKRRVYNALFRAGFEADAIRAELDARRAASITKDEGWDDDLE